MMFSSTVQPLVYHRVCADRETFRSEYVVSVSSFRRQMEHIASRGINVVGLDALTPGSNGVHDSGRPRVLLTFDDGYEDNFLHAFPILREFGFPAVIFLVADFSRRTNWWDRGLGIPEVPLLQPEQIAEMAAHNVEFGSHTLGHRSLPGLSDGDLRGELVGSRSAVEHVTSRPVRAFSYPYSHVNERVKRFVQSAGYTWSFAVNGGPLRATMDQWEIRRVNVTDDAHGLRFTAKLAAVEKFGLWTWWKVVNRSGRKSHFTIWKGF